MQDKTWYSILGVDAEPLSIKNLLLRILIKGSNLDAGSRSKYPCLMGLFLIWLVYNTDRFLRRYDFWLESFKKQNYMNLLPPYELKWLSYTGSKSKSMVWFYMELFIKLPQYWLYFFRSSYSSIKKIPT